MKAIRFTLSSEFAFFKNADIRSGKGKHFTYNHIHPVSILGIVGAIIGLEGYNIHHLRKQLGLETSFFSEFYEKLQNLKMSIVPNTEFDSFSKQTHDFTDTTVFSNADGTLMAKEQWLRQPSWDIYLLLDGSIDAELEEKIEDYLLNQKTVFIPYIGKNDHPARISNSQIVKLEPREEECQVDSLFLLNERLEEKILEQEDEANYFLFEFLPSSLSAVTGNYSFEKMAYTDAVLHMECQYDGANNRNLCFL